MDMELSKLEHYERALLERSMRLQQDIVADTNVLHSVEKKLHHLKQKRTITEMAEDSNSDDFLEKIVTLMDENEIQLLAIRSKFETFARDLTLLRSYLCKEQVPLQFSNLKNTLLETTDKLSIQAQRYLTETEDTLQKLNTIFMDVYNKKRKMNLGNDKSPSH